MHLDRRRGEMEHRTQKRGNILNAVLAVFSRQRERGKGAAERLSFIFASFIPWRLGQKTAGETLFPPEDFSSPPENGKMSSGKDRRRSEEGRGKSPFLLFRRLSFSSQLRTFLPLLYFVFKRPGGGGERGEHPRCCDEGREIYP